MPDELRIKTNYKAHSSLSSSTLHNKEHVDQTIYARLCGLRLGVKSSSNHGLHFSQISLRPSSVVLQELESHQLSWPTSNLLFSSRSPRTIACSDVPHVPEELPEHASPRTFPYPPCSAPSGGLWVIPKLLTAKALIFHKGTASLAATAPDKLLIRAKHPGKTSLLIRYKDGERQLYEIVIIPG